jgi:hypothetical protein
MAVSPCCQGLLILRVFQDSEFLLVMGIAESTPALWWNALGRMVKTCFHCVAKRQSI